MCGIVGMVGKITAKEETAFKILSKLDTIRGEDSTGVCSVTKTFGDWAYLKNVGTAFDFFEDKETVKMMNRQHAMLFGHNRAATRGVVNVDNAHPFRCGDFVGCHNGTLHVTSNLEDHKRFRVDSENIFHDMSINGHVETLQRLRGAFALCWYDIKGHTVNLVRNWERPMTYCFSEDHKTMFWASEAWMLHVALRRADIKFEEPLTLETKKLLTVQVPTVSAYLADKLNVEITDVEFYKEPPVTTGNFWGYVTKAEKEIEKTEKEKKNNVVPINKVKDVKNYSKKYMGKVITFSCAGLAKKKNLEYLSCEVVEDENAPELRVFTPTDNGLGLDLLTSPHLFKGKVKAVTVYGNECYLVCDNRTIVAIEEEDEMVQQGEKDNLPALLSMDFLVFENERVNLAEYLHRTSYGCMVCGNVATVSDADELMWVAKEDYFCPKCKNGQLAAQYAAINSN